LQVIHSAFGFLQRDSAFECLAARSENAAAGVHFFFAPEPLLTWRESGFFMRRFLFDHSLALAFLLFPSGFALLSGLILPTLGLSAQAQTAPAATAAARRPMSFEDLMKMKRLGDTAVSPNGKWLAYSATIVDLEQNTKTAELFIQPIAAAGAASGEAKPLAAAQPGDSGAQFAPDGKQILFLSSRSGSRQIWLADFDPATGATANPTKLTTMAAEAGDAIWSPDGHSVLFTSVVYPDCPAITVADFATGDKCNADRDAAATASKVKAQIFTHLLYRHWDHYTGEKRFHLFLLSVKNSGIRDLTPKDLHDVPPFALEGGGCGCAFAPDSKELAFTENLDPEPAISVSAQIFTLDLTNPAAKPVKVSTSAGGNFNPAYSPDGRFLAWRSEARAGYESDRFRLVVYDRAAKTVKDLLPDFDRWVEEFAWGTDSKKIYPVAGNEGEEPIFKATLDGRLTQLTGEGYFSGLHPLFGGQQLLTSGSVFSGLRPLPGGQQILASRMTVESPAEVVVADVAAGAPDANARISAAGISGTAGWGPITVSQVSKLTHLNDAQLAQLDLPRQESFWFTAADGTKLQGFLIRPPGFDPAKKYPVKFLIHGGPQGAWGDSWSYRWNPELFAANGYVVVMINPRGSTGYGQKIVDGVNGDWGGKPFTDLMQGLDYAEEHFPFIDKSREAALGASYGGFMANWILGHTDRFRCIVSHDGMFSPESAYGATEELWFNEWEFKGKPWEYYGKPDSENPFRKWSPALSAKNFKTPTLVIHGQLDYRLDVSEGFQLFTTLQRLHVPSKMLYFPDEGHWVLKPQNSELWYKTVNEWVDEWTK
jgi:dipeptidyl aminopeptidase/acylaminoacyl peptidase